MTYEEFNEDYLNEFIYKYGLDRLIDKVTKEYDIKNIIFDYLCDSDRFTIAELEQLLYGGD